MDLRLQEAELHLHIARSETVERSGAHPRFGRGRVQYCICESASVFLSPEVNHFWFLGFMISFIDLE
jgi:hypothetical protein